MAEFVTVMQKHRNELPVKHFKLGGRICIENIDSDTKLKRQGSQSDFHIVAKIAIGARDQR